MPKFLANRDRRSNTVWGSFSGIVVMMGGSKLGSSVRTCTGDVFGDEWQEAADNVVGVEDGIPKAWKEP